MSDSLAQLFQTGVTLLTQGQAEKAAAVFDDVIAQAPGHNNALHYRGILYLQQGAFAKAEDLIGRAVAINGRDGMALANLGVALRYQGKHGESLAAFDRALQFPPVSPETHFNRGLTLLDLEHFDAAIAGFNQVLQLAPNHVGAVKSRGAALDRLGHYEAALADFNQVAQAYPNSFEDVFNVAHPLYCLGRYGEAASYYQKAVALKSDYAEAQVGVAECKLLLSAAEDGWQEYEWRWALRTVGTAFDRTFTMPRWTGQEDIVGKTILLHGEQGFGDSLQFCRYVPEVARRAGRVILEVQPALKRLLSSLQGIAEIYGRGETLPPTDYHCPLMSLPLALGLTKNKLPERVPYLTPPAEAVAAWGQRLSGKTRPRVGLVWYSIRGKAKEMHRSVPPDLWEALSTVDATFVSLQLALRPEDREIGFFRDQILDFGTDLRDFADTAALIANLDLVISVDTATAHLAGALGKPVWILLSRVPDWRWGLEKPTTGWYPSARLFRQAVAGAWEPVIHEVRAALTESAAPSRPKA
jgi:tetratricopeptide (TPR) repeat protein